MEELNIYTLSRDWNRSGMEVVWHVEATATEIVKLADLLDNEEGCCCSCFIDNNKEVTHQFDGDGVLWCKMPVQVWV
jgi:hypothetical protein